MKVKHQNFDVIHPLENPYDKQGGLSVLFGNLAPKGAVIKVGGVDPSIKVFTGKAICFNSHDEAVEAIDNHTVRKDMLLLLDMRDLREVLECQKC